MKIRIEKYIIGITLLLLAACAKQPVEPVGPVPQGEGTTIHYRATVSEGATRATTDGFNQYIFETGDILYLEGEKMHGSLPIRSGAGETTAVFEGYLVCDEGYIPAEGDALSATLVSETAVNCGFYTFDANGKLQEPVYPSDQFAATFADAVSKYSVFTIDGAYGDASFILQQRSSFLLFTIRCDKGKVHAGDNVLVSFYNNGAATPIRSANVQATDYGAYTRTSFVTALPGGTSLSGASLSVKWGSGTDDHKEFTDFSDASLSANKYYNINRDAVIPYPGFRIRATQNTTQIKFRFNYNDGGTEYSTDNGNNWTQYTNTSSAITLNKDEELCVRATRTSYQNVADDFLENSKYFTIQDKPLMTADQKVYIAGNIMSLIKDGLETGVLPAPLAFAGAFAKNGDTSTIDIDPDDPLILPATTLTRGCYTRMFFRCTGLTTAPALPATELADFCYYNMFRQCYNLTDLSLFSATDYKLPATELKLNCYRELFRQCTSLTAVPKGLLSATNLAVRCYQQMFQGCTALTQVPDLPAGTLVERCYQQMFSGCTKITQSPDLPAGILVTACYIEMFNGCSSLKNITCMATQGINEDDSTTNWVKGVSGTGGTFIKKNGIIWQKGNNGYPSNWTIVGVD